MNFKSKQSKYYHRAKSVRIRSLSGSYSVRMREKVGQKNFECGHFLRSVPVTDSGPHYISKTELALKYLSGFKLSNILTKFSI